MARKKMIYPVVPLRGVVVLPSMMVHFDCVRRNGIDAIRDALTHGRKIIAVCQNNIDVLDPHAEDLFDKGCICEVKQITTMSEEHLRVTVKGISACEIYDLIDDEASFITACGKVYSKIDDTDANTSEAMIRVLKEQVVNYASLEYRFPREAIPTFLNIFQLEDLLDKIAFNMPMDFKIRQHILECTTFSEEYTVLTGYLMDEANILSIKQQFQSELKENIDKNQKEYILREQLKVIEKQLGDADELTDAEEYEKRCKKLKADASVKKRIRKEINRMKTIPPIGQELSIIRTYIETLLELPWNTKSKDSSDINMCSQILDRDHYGLEKVKERIVEYLAVRMLNPNGKGAILCLAGPPGTGKTSIAQSVARALNKQFVRISLGGVRDEAEIRGHRRTYVGAMPGRIVEGLRSAGVSNPLMLLDEIDKTSSDYRDDISSALLEVLDHEQNYRFKDHYVELPVDLSGVLFIATANDIGMIPMPLLDRMEIIEINSYTENEKFHIAKDYLLEKQRKECGIDVSQVEITDGAIRKVIHNYTREAGVRNLERRIGDLYRKNARKILEGYKRKIVIKEGDLTKYLGKEKVSFDIMNKNDEVGLVTGLAWTAAGGDTLQIEVNIMAGKGSLILTGQLGDVMKESAQAALGCVRNLSSKYGIKKDYFEKHDIHVHIPEGAVPKDGPSAGVTMGIAMLSAVTGRKTRANFAMTGEITIRGRILPVGGLKEKLIAAYMAEKDSVLIPDRNRPDIEELSEEITGKLNIIYIKTFTDAVQKTILGSRKTSSRKTLTRKTRAK